LGYQELSGRGGKIARTGLWAGWNGAGGYLDFEVLCWLHDTHILRQVDSLGSCHSMKVNENQIL